MAEEIYNIYQNVKPMAWHLMVSIVSYIIQTCNAKIMLGKTKISLLHSFAIDASNH